ncbi:MAG: hypothetical protein AAGE03_11910 [Pseudomonadota bacterium]
MNWTPISEEALRGQLRAGEARMTQSERRFWDSIKTEPEKWQCPHWGDQGNGFWVVAIWGERVIWYNDIEEGFNASSYRSHGRFDEYRSEQCELDEILRRLMDSPDGAIPEPRLLRPPQPPKTSGLA